MDSAALVVSVLISAMAFLFGAAYLLEHRTQTKGRLFTRSVTPFLRIIALVLGLLFSCFFLYFHAPEMFILAVALFAYSLGASRFLQFIQRLDLDLKISKKNLAMRQHYYTLSPEEITGSRNKIHRVIAEISYKDTVIIVVGFKDGTSRLLIGNGASIFGKKESFPEATRISAQRLVRTSQVFVDKIPFEKQRLFPQKYFVKFVLVTEGGIHAIEESIKELESEQAGLHPLWVVTTQLLESLLKFQCQRENRPKELPDISDIRG